MNLYIARRTTPNRARIETLKSAMLRYSMDPCTEVLVLWHLSEMIPGIVLNALLPFGDQRRYLDKATIVKKVIYIDVVYHDEQQDSSAKSGNACLKGEIYAVYLLLY